MKQCRKVVKNRGFSSIDFKYRRFCFPLIVTVFLVGHLSVLAQNRTVGVIALNTDTAAGYTLFTPLNGKDTYLVDNLGCQINVWKSDKTSGASVYLLEDGSLLRCESMTNRSFNAGGSGGRVKKFSWEGDVTWTYDYSSDSYCQQHDVEPLPNGNVLILAWELKSSSEASAAGRSNATGNVWPDHLIEVKPSGATGGDIVWEWHVWDHLIQDKDESKANYGVVEDHPELADVNYIAHQNSTGDWMHTNSVDYNEEFDQIMITVRYFDEVWILDHSTNTAEAASHSGGNYGKGGDILYRFGNPAAYKSGTSSDRILNLQHCAEWIDKGLQGAGNVMVFNNGTTSSNRSSVDEFKLPVDTEGKYDMSKAPEKVWSYSASGFFAQNMSSGQRLANGNTLISDGPHGKFFEVYFNCPDKKVWEYTSPVTNTGITQQGQSTGGGMGMSMNQCFRATRYAPDHPAFTGKNITPPAAPLEGGELPSVDPSTCTTIVAVSSSADVHVSEEFSLSSYTHPSNPNLATAINFTIPRHTNVTVKIYNAGGREIATLVNRYLSAGNYSYTWSTNGCAGGVYFVRLVTKNYTAANRMVLLK
jgi:hypothetical protein